MTNANYLHVMTEAESRASEAAIDLWWEQQPWNVKVFIRTLVEEVRKPVTDLPIEYAPEQPEAPTTTVSIWRDGYRWG